MRPTSTPLPLLEDIAAECWRWPMPPFRWDVEAVDAAAAQQCRIETRSGATVEGEMTAFRPGMRTMSFRGGPAGAALILPFERFRRLTLTEPLRPLPRHANAPVERVPAAAQERDYRLTCHDGREPLLGRTAGRVESAEGLYLYAPFDEDRSLLRVFVPSSAFDACEFGPSAEEIAAERWICDPQALLDAIERQQHAPVLPLGQSLLDLGLVTPAQIERALARKSDDVPLGEALVADGVISRSDLQTALAHKMGYPLVDLTRFPIDPAVARKLPLRTALACRALPLMLHDRQLVVAVDRPSRVHKLQTLYALAEYKIAPVLASKMHIRLALANLPNQDVWSQYVAARPGYFATTS